MVKSQPNHQFQQFILEFTSGYRRLAIKELGPDYKDNLKEIVSADSLKAREIFFKKYLSIASNFKINRLSKKEVLEMQHFKYQANFGLQRISLEEKYLEESPSDNPLDGGLAKLKDGKLWYNLYVSKYTSKTITPDELLTLGETQVKFIKMQLKRLQDSLGYAGDDDGFYQRLNDSDFILTDEREIQSGYAGIQETVIKNLSNQFENTLINPVKIMPSPQSGAQMPPAYFDEGVFYYNFYRNSHNRRSMDYLFLHEGIPGHHYDAEQFKSREKNSLEVLFGDSYNGCLEGWAAYCEYLGQPLGIYKDPYSVVGRWEWDLVRSARVVIDVGIHYKGWSKDDALNYWRQTIPNQNGIAEREVNRCMKWPCQVLSYKVGAVTILKLKELARKTKGNDFDVRKFHTLILSKLRLPLQVMEASVIENLQNNH